MGGSVEDVFYSYQKGECEKNYCLKNLVRLVIGVLSEQLKSLLSSQKTGHENCIKKFKWITGSSSIPSTVKFCESRGKEHAL